MDDETAEIELLEQNLNKTRQISQRMTTILTSFDTRLAKLEKSILPLYNSTQILNRRAGNIEKTLLKIDEVASNQEGIAAEEALILRGPQPGQLTAYQDALERLNATIAFKSSDRDSRDTSRLVETGAKKLTQMYTKLVAEASSGAAPPPGSEYITSPFSSSLLGSVQSLVSFLRTLPQPSTHPSHPAAPAILSNMKEAQRGYADMRGSWSRKCLEAEGKRVVDRADTIDGVAAGREFGSWVENVISVAEEEHNLLGDLAPIPTSLPATYTTLLTPILALFSSTLSSLVLLIKRSLHKYTFLALSAYASLSSLQPRWDNLMTRRNGQGTQAGRDNINELKEGLHSLRAVCLRSFPELLADIKMAALGKGGELGTGIADFATSTVQYLERIPEVQDAAASALLSLGDGNWKMGEGVQAGKNTKLGDGDEAVILEHFMYDVVNTILASLTSLSRTQKRPSVGAVFLLNNISYFRNAVLEEPANPDLAGLLSKPTREVLNSNFRMAKAGYFDSNFMPLLQALADDPKEKTSGSASKAATKEKFTRFYDLLDELGERHKLAKVLEDDEEGRETIADEVVKLVVPLLQRFTQKQRDKDFSKNPQKYIKMSPEEVEKQIRGFYR